ncbi:MAG: aldehyde dehydrogenase family protein [Ectothiorhodospiraceae bacterium]|nr:aldehyde dehydrogenase family protein [Ectothiorhodospiraceae bacterium]
MSAVDQPRPLLLAGEWVVGEGVPLEVINPADGTLYGVASTASTAQAEAAVSAGVAAMARGDWAERLPHERAAVLHRVADRIRERAETLAQIQVSENGKTFKESLGQVLSAAATFRYYAAVCETLEDELPPPRGRYLSMTAYEPVGVVIAITPWNSPLTMGAQKLAPALAAGNAVVLKPAEWTSLVSLEMGRACVDAGLPPGLLSVLPGRGDLGQALVDDRRIGMVSFTGGTATGKAIARAAAERLLPVVLELGGKSPNIVLHDADLDAAAAGVADGIFAAGGQSCVAGSRLLVDQRVYEPFLDRLLKRAASLRVGHPEAEDTDIGPLAAFAHRETVERYVEIGRREGARVLFGGSRPTGDVFDRGAYYLPTVLTDLEPTATVCREEIFGPVLAVLPFVSDEDLIAAANATDYGLACGIWTADFPRAWRLARAIKPGTVWVNTYKQLSIAAPFGGFKDSGLGREKGIQGLRAYQETKSVYWGLE